MGLTALSAYPASLRGAGAGADAGARHGAPLCQAPPDCIADLFAHAGRTRKLAPGQTVCPQGGEIDTAFRVERGTVRACRYDRDGARKIVSFAGAGAVFGLAEPDRWRTAIEAVDLVVIRVVRKAIVEAALDRSLALHRELRILVNEEAAAREAHLATLTTLSAVDRVSRFLARHAAGHAGSGHVALPMSRRDIGDHLGLSIETVSRAFGKLRDEGVIAMKGCAMYRIVGREADPPEGDVSQAAALRRAG